MFSIFSSAVESGSEGARDVTEAGSGKKGIVVLFFFPSLDLSVFEPVKKASHSLK